MCVRSFSCNSFSTKQDSFIMFKCNSCEVILAQFIIFLVLCRRLWCVEHHEWWARRLWYACNFPDNWVEPRYMSQEKVELVRNLVAHGDAREGKWRGNWRMEWVASTLTPPPNVVYPALLKLMRTPRLPAVDWTDAPTDLNGLVPFGERRNLVSARVPSRSARAIRIYRLAVNWNTMDMAFLLTDCHGN